MKTKIILILLLVGKAVFSQSFYLNYVTPTYEEPMSIIEYKPDNYIVCGYYLKDYASGLLLKINSQGEISDSNKINLHEDFNLTGIFRICEDTLFITGITINEVYFAKIDTNLNILWDTTFRYFRIPDHYYNFSSPILNCDSNIVYAGYHHFGPNIFYDGQLFIYKFNLHGDSLDYQNYDTLYNYSSFATFIFQNPATEKYYVNLENELDEPMCYKINPDFTKDTIAYYESGDVTRPFMYKVSSKFYSDTTFISSLTYGIYQNNTKHAVLLLDTSFTIQNSVNLSFADMQLNTRYCYNNSIDFVDKNNIFIVSYKAVLSNIDSNFNVRWQKYYSPLDSNVFERWIYGVKATSDGGAIIIMSERIWDNMNISVIKTDSLGYVPLDIQKKYGIKLSDYKVYPNPASDYLKIFKAVQIPEAEFILYNTAGQTVLRKTLVDNLTEINVRDLPPSTYFYNIITNGKLADKGKIILKK